ncbi:MAG: hypothetical protein ORN51_15470 [Akkermansiaceae bacterium]|nr:hypothetical protein [Akkermansiaceae bacterium]
MATPNYAFEKRRRELDKKAKKEEKRKQKLASGANASDDALDPTAAQQDSSPSQADRPAV